MTGQDAAGNIASYDVIGMSSGKINEKKLESGYIQDKMPNWCAKAAGNETGQNGKGKMPRLIYQNGRQMKQARMAEVKCLGLCKKLLWDRSAWSVRRMDLVRACCYGEKQICRGSTTATGCPPRMEWTALDRHWETFFFGVRVSVLCVSVCVCWCVCV